MMVSQKVMDALKSIGLNLYERKLWVALLARGTATAGELSQMSNVPRSRTYDVLESLAEKGFVIIQTAKPLRYVAVAPEEALERAKKKLEEKFKSMVERIDSLKQSDVIKELNELFEKGMEVVSPEEITGALKGKYSVLQQVESMIKSANTKIDIVTTPEGLKDIVTNHLNFLIDAKNRGVKIRIAVKPGEGALDAIKALSGIADVRIIKEDIPISGRFYVVDGEQLVFGLTSGVHSSQDLAFWSKSPHAASGILEPLFELAWKNSLPAEKFKSG